MKNLLREYQLCIVRLTDHEGQFIDAKIYIFTMCSCVHNHQCGETFRRKPSQTTDHGLKGFARRKVNRKVSLEKVARSDKKSTPSRNYWIGGEWTFWWSLYFRNFKYKGRADMHSSSPTYYMVVFTLEEMQGCSPYVTIIFYVPMPVLRDISYSLYCAN